MGQSLEEKQTELLEPHMRNWTFKEFGNPTGKMIAYLCVSGAEFGEMLDGDEEEVANTIKGSMQCKKLDMIRDLGPMLASALVNKGPQLVDFKAVRDTSVGNPPGAFVYRLEAEYMAAPGEGQRKEIIELKKAVARAGNAVSEARQESADRYWSYQLQVEELQRRLKVSAPERSTVEEF